MKQNQEAVQVGMVVYLNQDTEDGVLYVRLCKVSEAEPGGGSSRYGCVPEPGTRRWCIVCEVV